MHSYTLQQRNRIVGENDSFVECLNTLIARSLGKMFTVGGYPILSRMAANQMVYIILFYLYINNVFLIDVNAQAASICLHRCFSVTFQTRNGMIQWILFNNPISNSIPCQYKYMHDTCSFPNNGIFTYSYNSCHLNIELHCTSPNWFY